MVPISALRSVALCTPLFAGGLPAPLSAAPHQVPAVPQDPGARSSHVMVYHEGLGQVVMFGGVRQGRRDAVWGWDGDRWVRLGTDGGPGSRGHFAFAYDGRGERLLLHGGLGLTRGDGEVSRHGDLWVWEDGGWHRVHGPESGPGVRDHHAMVWDAARGEVVLFGGGRGVPGDQELLGDTWVLGGSGWRRHEGQSPPARATHRLAYDAVRERVVLFGGWGENGLLADTWEWDGTEWQRVEAQGPGARLATRMVYDARLERVILHGGRDQGGNLGDTWEWDGVRWEPQGSAGPSPRNVHGLAYDAARGNVVLFGGLGDGGRLSDVWEREGRSWRRADRRLPDEMAPEGRGAAAGAWQPEERRLLVFGGIGGEPRAFGDLWAWRDGEWSRLPVGPNAPSPRFNVAAAYMAGRDELVLYGGGGIDEVLGDTWLFDGRQWRRHTGSGPPPRSCARMVYRPDVGDVLLYGGEDAAGRPLDETWRWDGGGWTLLDRGAPPASCFHAGAYHREAGHVVHFGGRGDEEGTTWVRDGAGWRPVPAPGPPARDHHAMAYDASRGEVVLTGGGGRDEAGEWDGTALDDTWVWDGRAWEERPDAGAPPRFHAPVLVGTDEGVMMFGGSSPTGSHADVWQWDGARWHRLSPPP